MEIHEFRFDFKDGDEFNFLLSSDIHAEEPGFSEELFLHDYEEARRRKARILVNGDLGGYILPQDLKRYARSADLDDSDDKIGRTVENLERRFSPYVDLLDMMGCGNHETAVLKYHASDVTKLLIGFLNRRRAKGLAPIRHGGYSGIFRLVFENKSRKRAYKFDTYYNHGQGGSAEVTHGIIDLQRRQNYEVDLVWGGHKHKKLLTELPAGIGLSKEGRLYQRRKYGLVTGCYLRNFAETDAGKNGYRLNYAEERMRTPQGQGGAFLRIVAHDEGLDARFEL